MADRVRVHALIDSLTCGGAEVVLAEFARASRQQGIDLTVGYLVDRDGSPIAARLRAAGIEPMRVDAPGGLNRATLAAVRRQVLDVRPDLVHTHLDHSDLLGGRVATSLGIPWISTVHAMAWEGSARMRTRARLAYAARAARAARVITVSRSARDAYLARAAAAGPWYRRARRGAGVEIVPNGIRGHREPESGRLVRSGIGLRDGDRLVVLNSPFRLEKGHRQAFAALAGIPRVHAAVIGDGPDGAAVREACSLGENVSWLGYRDDVMGVLAAADVVLHTPLTDALPTGLIEAAAAGVPVVATATGGIPEIVEHGRTGVLVPPRAPAEQIADALSTVLADGERRARLGAAARRRFERSFAAPIWTRRLRGLYDATLAEAGR